MLTLSLGTRPFAEEGLGLALPPGDPAGEGSGSQTCVISCDVKQKLPRSEAISAKNPI